MQNSTTEYDEGGHGEKKEPALEEGKKKSTKTFKRHPRSEKRNEDKMQIDVKKRLLSSDENDDIEGTKRQKADGGSLLLGARSWTIS
jgi:hypothetical protein